MTSFLYLYLQGKSVGKYPGCVVSEQETHRWSTGLAASTSFQYSANASAPPHNVALSAPCCVFVCMHMYIHLRVHAYMHIIIILYIIHMYMYTCVCV